MTEPVHVLWHDGVSYVEHDKYRSKLGGYDFVAHINGKPYTDFKPAVGDENYLAVKGPVKTIRKHFKPKRVVVHYVARPEFADAIKAPLSVAEYEGLDEDRRAVIYEAVYREDPVAPVDLPFVVTDLDCAPRTFPEGVKVTVPAYLKRMRNTWHTLPCILEKEGLFKRLADAVLVECKGKPHFEVTHYDNIQTLTVYANVKVEGFHQEFRFKVMDWSGEGRHGGRIPPTITGANLDDLKAKVEGWVNGQLDLLRSIHKPTHCPCCTRKLPRDSNVVVGIGRR